MPPPTHIVTMPYFALAALHFLQQRGGELGARAAQRMPQRDGAAVHVHLGQVEAQHLDHGQRLRRERLVQLDQVDLVQRQSRQLQRLGDGVHRPHPHLLRKAAGVGIGHQRASGLMPSACARSTDITTAAAAPSEVCDELPAVTVPLAWKAGLSLASASSEVSARGPSSTLNSIFGLAELGLRVRRGKRDRAPARSPRSNLPAACAASAFWWLASANWSASSRVMP